MTTHRLGFMQGRLSPLVDGRIQAFPASCWREEFPAAHAIGLHLMEWTLDHEGLWTNPLLTADGAAEVAHLTREYGLLVPSVTCDALMQAPMHVPSQPGEPRTTREELRELVQRIQRAGVRILVVPLVDAGWIADARQWDAAVAAYLDVEDLLRATGTLIAFESDFPPEELARFMRCFPEDCYGVNYDIGNSAALGFDPEREFGEYAERIVNVHVKDRAFGGTTVPLGMGNANLTLVAALLAQARYAGNYIMQTARAADGDHAAALIRYQRLCDDLGWR